MHLDTETVVNLLEGRLERTTTAEWTEHIDSCSACFALQEEWQQFRQALKRSHLESAPQHMLDAAERIFAGSPAVSKQRTGLREVIAKLAFDSFLAPAFAGARGSAAARQMVLRAEEFDIHVRIYTTEENRELLGQIQPRGDQVFLESARLHLLQDGERISSAEVNDLGEFQFRFVPEGLLSLQIDLPHLTVIGALDTSTSSRQ